MRQFHRLALLFGLAAAAAGCGSQNEPAPAQTKAPAPVRKAPSPADALSPYLVAAVTTAKSGASLVQVKFEVAARPAVGEPVDVDLVLVPAVDHIEQISGTVSGDDGLEVLSGGTLPAVEKPVFGTPIHHALKVRARRDGVFTLSAALTVDADGQTLAPVYSIPLIAGKGLADIGAGPAPARSPATRPPTPPAK